MQPGGSVAYDPAHHVGRLAGARLGIGRRAADAAGAAGGRAGRVAGGIGRRGRGGGARRARRHAGVVGVRGRCRGVRLGGRGGDGGAHDHAGGHGPGRGAVVAARRGVVGDGRRRVVVGRRWRRGRVGVGRVIGGRGRVVVGAAHRRVGAPLGVVGRPAVRAGRGRALAVGVGRAAAVGVRRGRLPRPLGVGRRPTVGARGGRPLAGGVGGAAAVGAGRGGRALAVRGRPSVAVGVGVGGGGRRVRRARAARSSRRRARFFMSDSPTWARQGGAGVEARGSLRPLEGDDLRLPGGRGEREGRGGELRVDLPSREVHLVAEVSAVHQVDGAEAAREPILDADPGLYEDLVGRVRDHVGLDSSHRLRPADEEGEAKVRGEVAERVGHHDVREREVDVGDPVGGLERPIDGGGNLGVGEESLGGRPGRELGPVHEELASRAGPARDDPQPVRALEGDVGAGGVEQGRAEPARGLVGDDGREGERAGGGEPGARSPSGSPPPSARGPAPRAPSGGPAARVSRAAAGASAARAGRAMEAATTRARQPDGQKADRTSVMQVVPPGILS